MSCLNQRFRVFVQNKPAMTCSRAGHVGFQTDSVTSNSDSVSKILNCDKVAKSQSRKFIKYEYRMDYLLKVKPSGIRARLITYSESVARNRRFTTTS